MDRGRLTEPVQAVHRGDDADRAPTIRAPLIAPALADRFEKMHPDCDIGSRTTKAVIIMADADHRKLATAARNIGRPRVTPKAA